MTHFIIRNASIIKKNSGILENPTGFVEKVQEKRQDENKLLFATIIKKIRTDKHITINNLSKDICSISYLSKLENGLIETNEATINLLFDRLGVSYDSFKGQNTKIDLRKLVRAYADSNIEKLEEAYLDIKDCPLNIYKPIVDALYHLAIHDLPSAYNEIKELEPVKETLGQYAATVYLFIVIEYYIKNYLFDNAYEYLKLSEFLSIDDEYLKFLYLESMIITGYHLNNQVLLFNAYHNYTSNISPAYSLKRRMEVIFIYLLNEINEYPNEVVDNLEKYDNSLFSSDIDEIIYYYKYLIKATLYSPKEAYNEMTTENKYLNKGRVLGLLSYLGSLKNFMFLRF